MPPAKSKRKTGTLGELWVSSVLPEDIAVSRPILDKKGLANILSLVAKKYPDKYRDISHKLNKIGAEASYTTGGNSFGLEDMRKSLRARHRQMRFQKQFEEVLNDDSIDDAARNKKIIELTSKLTDGLADEVFEESFAEQNPLALQIIGSGRGNKGSLVSLRAGDGLYEDHRNNVIPVPVTNSYSQGLTPLQYWASTYGARQGVLATKFAVQDAGAFSKQLNQITHRLLVTADDRDKESDTPIGLPVETEDDDSVGSLLAYPVAGYKRNTIITPKILADIRKKGINEILVRSPAVSGAPDGGLYAKDAGIREFGNFPVRGENIGLVASQALGEPLSQSQLCLAVDTPVRMADFTIKRLGDIQPEEWVLGADKHGNLFPVRVKARYDNGVRKCIRYVFRTEEQDYLEFVSTDDHKFLVKFNGAEDVVPVHEAAASDSFCLQAAVDGKLVSCQFFVLELKGEVETCDIEVDHPDHLFVLANGLITSNSAKHSGGVAGQVRSLSGFDLLNELVQIPKKFKDSAAHAEVDGRIRSIEKAPAGGYYIYIGDTRHYVPLGFKPMVQVGQAVEAGDVLSEGVPNPAMITKYKGIGEGRRYFIKTMKQAMEDSGITAHRRNIEILARGLINHVRFKDETEDYVQDDIVPYSMVEHSYTPREGFKSLSPLQASGKYLERPYLHYEIGTKVKPSVVKMLNRYNINKIDVHEDEPIFEPVMIRGMANLHHDPDWITQMYGSGLKSSLLESTQRGGVSDRHGTSFVPSRARAVDFGREGKVITPKRSVLAKKQWPDLMD